MEDILRQKWLSATAPKVLPVLTVPSQLPMWPPPSCPWPKTPCQYSLQNPDLTGDIPEERCLQPCLMDGPQTHSTALFPALSLSSHFFAPDWAPWMDLDPGSSLAVPSPADGPWQCSDTAGQYLLVRTPRRTPASPHSWTSSTLTAPWYSQVRSWGWIAQGWCRRGLPTK